MKTWQVLPSQVIGWGNRLTNWAKSLPPTPQQVVLLVFTVSRVKSCNVTMRKSREEVVALCSPADDVTRASIRNELRRITRFDHVRQMPRSDWVTKRQLFSSMSQAFAVWPISHSYYFEVLPPPPSQRITLCRILPAPCFMGNLHDKVCLILDLIWTLWYEYMYINNIQCISVIVFAVATLSVNLCFCIHAVCSCCRFWYVQVDTFVTSCSWPHSARFIAAVPFLNTMFCSSFHALYFFGENWHCSRNLESDSAGGFVITGSNW